MSDQPHRPHLLITGATGMVGACVLARLLRSGQPCTVIARPKGKLDAKARVEQILNRFENAWGTKVPRPAVFQGDLNQTQLGLSLESIDWISSHCDSVLHSAASLSFSPASENEFNEPYRTNVGGTENVVRLSEQVGLTHFHHVSTAYTCGMQTGRVMESAVDVGQSFANDYEYSKVQAELLVRKHWLSERSAATKRAAESSPRTLTVYRPSIVIDPIGLTPVSGDRTIYGAFSMYQMLASRFGLPAEGEWFRNLGFTGDERKNLIDVHWIAEAIETILGSQTHYGRTYHLTADGGTSINELDKSFRSATSEKLRTRKPSRRSTRQPGFAPAHKGNAQSEIDKLAAPFVKTFLPYFKDDPIFDRTNIDSVIAQSNLPKTPSIGEEELKQMVDNWSAATVASGRATHDQAARKTTMERPATPVPAKDAPNDLSSAPSSEIRSAENRSAENGSAENGNADDIVLVSYEVRLPGGVDNASQFEQLLYRGQSAIDVLPAERLDRELYLHPTPGTPGKTYTEIGGCVRQTPTNLDVDNEIQRLGDFDLTHRQFAHVAVAAVESSIGRKGFDACEAIDLGRAGVFVGHSGGTELGGALALATLGESATRLLHESADVSITQKTREQVRSAVTDGIRETRPRRSSDGSPELNAYSAASLAARLVGFKGRREVIDAACSSSLIALHHAANAIHADRLDLAIVGGATYNNVDNLALFSQTGACSAKGSFPFDSRASGLVSSEGYVAVLIARRRVAEAAGMNVLATLHGVGISSDGKGKGLWAPRTEGQQLAMRRAVADQPPLSIDYLECHATSTQVGDATELESLDTLLKGNRAGKLPIGSVKSNLGHLLEAAGLVGMVKCLIAMKRGEIPPSINFSSPSPSFDWESGSVRVVDRVERWPAIDARGPSKVAAVNAFGIGGLNAHAVIEQETLASRSQRPNVKVVSRAIGDEPIAIVGRGLVMPGAANLAEYASLLVDGKSRLEHPPADRWPRDMNGPIGLAHQGSQQDHYFAPHAMGGYVHGFRFDAQAYRIPPKVVANANPAQLMLIEAVRQAMDEFDGGNWTLDRQRVGVTIGTMFGGQFSNELQIGLRLPEICRDITRHAIAAGVAPSTAKAWADSYRKLALKTYPALLDETGGFTASTLASRIARTFDLMGGACAVDADEASSGLAILTASEQLASGQIDAVLCGTAQRSIDLVALEQLYRNDRLACRPSPQESILDPSRVFPAEGVAIILLQRLSDARKGKHPILGTIQDGKESYTSDVVSARREYGRESLANDPVGNPKLVAQSGHLGGGQGLVQTIAATIAAENQELRSPVRVQETASDGYQIQYTVSHPDQKVQPPTLSAPVIQSVHSSSVLSICLQSKSVAVLREQLQGIATNGISGSEACTSLRDGSGPFSAILVAESDEELRNAAQELLSGPIAQGRSGVAAKSAALVKLYDVNSPRIAWTFPGQGSQYSSVPRVFDIDDECQPAIDLFDRELAAMGLEPVGNRLGDPESRLGKDIWWTQAWLLAVGTSLTESLFSRGLRPDVVLGHSFGECTAAWAAGVMSTKQAIDFAKSRSDAVTMHGGPRGELLSVRAEPSRIDSILRLANNDCVITHQNSPMQTVVAGSPESVAHARTLLSDDGIASVVIPVPAAFHTPAMRPARDILAARLSSARMRPPRFAFLSATQNRYLAEPSEIGDNLVDQLICPVGFSGAVDRLVNDGCGLIIEVGPSNVLTRLARATLDGRSQNRAICISADEPNVPIACSYRLVELATELFSGSAVNRADDVANASSTLPDTLVTKTQPAAEVSSVATDRFQVVDVTRRGRRPANGNANAPSKSSLGPSKFSANDASGNKTSGTNASGNDVPQVAAVGQPASDERVVRPEVIQASVQSIPGTPSPAPIQTANVSTDSFGNDRLDLARSFLFDLVVDLTGYEPEIIDFEADLEAELGVDSIKKAQLIGELVQWGGLSITTQDIRLAEYQSMSDILGLIPSDATPVDLSGDAPIGESAEQSFSVPADVDSEELRRLMIDLLVDQTGYDEEIIDMDADLESELGVDSIKRAQLLGELEQQFELPPIQQTDLKLSDFPTLRTIHEFIMAQVGDRKKKSLLS